jgi:hypothetical protein
MGYGYKLYDYGLWAIWLNGYGLYHYIVMNYGLYGYIAINYGLYGYRLWVQGFEFLVVRFVFCFFMF